MYVKYFAISEKSSTFASQLRNEPLVDAIEYRGVEQLVARQAHNLEVACSSPASATNKSKFFKEFRLFYFHNIVFTPTAGQRIIQFTEMASYPFLLVLSVVGLLFVRMGF